MSLYRFMGEPKTKRLKGLEYKAYTYEKEAIQQSSLAEIHHWQWKNYTKLF